MIRGFKLKSPFAPVEGYRYDGLYIVEKAWMAKGLTNGLMVCRYAFKRVGGQPGLMERPVEAENESEGNGDLGAEAEGDDEEGGIDGAL